MSDQGQAALKPAAAGLKGADRRSASDAIAWLSAYRDEPSVFLLLMLAGTLRRAEDHAAVLAETGISAGWLAGQGEAVAQASEQAVRDASGCTGQELRALRRALESLGVSCDGWAVSDGDIARSLLRYARMTYQEAVTRMSPFHGWEVLRLAAEGHVPGLDAVAPGARDVIAGYAVRFVRESMSDIDAPAVLRELRAMLPGLDPEVRDSFRRAGLPASEPDLRHAEELREVGRFWERCRSGDDDDGLVLALACRHLLADRTVRPGEIGTTEGAVWAAARSWVTGQAARVKDGDHEAGCRLAAFARWSGLGYGPFGITAGQAAGWEEDRIRDCWARARAGDGGAAFDVVLHCGEEGNSYERTTGLPAARARAELQLVMNDYAAGLRRQVETASSRKWARKPFEELRDFASRVREVNDHAAERDGRPLVEAPWDMPPAGWRELHARYVCDTRKDVLSGPGSLR